MLSDFGAPCGRDGGRSRSLPPSAPFGLSAVSEISSGCLPSLLAVTAFPPPELSRLRPPFLGLLVVCAHPTPLVPSSSVLSSFLTTASPSGSAQAERSPRVRTWNFPLHRRPYALPPTDIGLRLLTASSPKGRAPHDASLPFDAGFHLRLPPDLPSRARQGFPSGKDLVPQIDAPVSSVLG